MGQEFSFVKCVRNRLGWFPGRSLIEDVGDDRGFLVVDAPPAMVGFARPYLLRPNANSLHQLYRDRLSKAFLFDPTELARTRFGQKNNAWTRGAILRLSIRYGSANS
jgi:hypothetical protein